MSKNFEELFNTIEKRIRSKNINSYSYKLSKMNERLYKIISQVFNVRLEDINEESGPENLEEWDSFKFLVLIDKIETEFNTKIDLKDILEIKKVRDLEEVISKYI